jgi:hypothetical protein
MKIFFLALIAMNFPVQAAIFKCTINPYKTIYQATPCVSEINEQKIDIKTRDAKQEAAAVESLKKWEAKYNAQQAAEKKALKAEKNKSPRTIIVQVIQRPQPQLRMRKPSRRRMMNLR